MKRTTVNALRCVPGSEHERLLIAAIVNRGGAARLPEMPRERLAPRRGGVMPGHLDPRFL